MEDAGLPWKKHIFLSAVDAARKGLLKMRIFVFYRKKRGREDGR